jgi:Flp pilus assembly protein TadG
MMRGIVHRLSDVIKRLAACQRGGPAIEMGIVLPVLCLAIVGTVYTGWMIWSATMLSYAVESAARCVAVATVNSVNCSGNNPTAQRQATKTYAVSQAIGVNVTTANFAVTQPANGCGWQVTATYPFTFMLPFQPTNPVYSITTSACFLVQS